jgi:hypothetical protein
MKIRIESVTGLNLMNAEGSYRFAAECFQQCDRDPGCLPPFRIVIDDEYEYFAEDVAMLLEEKE